MLRVQQENDSGKMDTITKMNFVAADEEYENGLNEDLGRLSSTQSSVGMH